MLENFKVGTEVSVSRDTLLQLGLIFALVAAFIVMLVVVTRKAK